MTRTIRQKRIRRELDCDVVTAARARIGDILDTFDSFIVSFSGGKDSLVVLHLVKQVLESRGVDVEKRPIRAVFEDEEIIDPAIADFVAWYAQQPWINVRWLCTQREGSLFVLGQRIGAYIEWDPTRTWMRPMPEGAVTSDHPLDAQERREAQISGLRGRVAILVGVRADESLARLSGVMACPTIPYVARTKESKRALFGKPIYDWSENDVMKFLAENEIEWCSVYDAQHATGSMLRVSTPTHSATAKKLDELARQNPEFYDRLLEAFPDLYVQARYWKDYKASLPAKLENYAAMGWQGVYTCLGDTVTQPAHRSRILKQLQWCESREKTSPGMYPPEFLIREILRGFSHGNLMPANRSDQSMFAAREKARQERRSINGQSINAPTTACAQAS